MYVVNLLGESALLWRVSLATLSKPPLQPNLDNLNQGLLDNLHSPLYTLTMGPGMDGTRLRDYYFWCQSEPCRLADV